MLSDSKSQENLNPIKGAIKECTIQTFTGWVETSGINFQFTDIDIFLDDEFYLQISADLESRGLVTIEKNSQESNRADFTLWWNLPPHARSLKVSAKIASTGQHLNGSPIFIEPPSGAIAPIEIEDEEAHTQKTKEWLDTRYQYCYQDSGVYLAHQPVYGFNSPYSEPGLIDKYLVTYQIMHTLSTLDFATLLDVGGSEGYKAAMARDFFDISALSSDISKAACDRARDLYNIPAKPSDMRKLDFDSESFDVVLCSESVEHVMSPKSCIEDMLRVAKKAVLITVPHESHEISCPEHIRRRDARTHKLFRYFIF